MFHTFYHLKTSSVHSRARSASQQPPGGVVCRDAHETLQSETETRSEIPGHETETRPRCSKIRPRRDETESLNRRDETETRPSV